MKNRKDVFSFIFFSPEVYYNIGCKRFEFILPLISMLVILSQANPSIEDHEKCVFLKILCIMKKKKIKFW